MAPRKQRGDGQRAEQLFLELLSPEGFHGCKEVTADDLREVAELAYRHAVFLPVDRRIRESVGLFAAGLVDEEYVPSVRPLRQRHITHTLHYERLEWEVLALLDAAAVPSVILKGSALSRDLYGEPHYRTSADIDLLVRPEDVPAADTALRAAGYRRDNELPLSFWMRRLHHAVYQHPGSRVPVEIHWNFSIPGFFNLDPEEIWAGVEIEGLRGRLSAEMTLTLLLMHHHLHGCADLRTLVDIAWACERHREVTESDRWHAHLERTGLHVVAGIARLQAETLWGLRHGEIGGHRGRYRLRVHLLASAAGSALRPGRGPRASDKYLYALIHRLGLDSPRRVVASITKTLLPSAADIRVLTGQERVGAAGYVQYFRWRLGGRAAWNDERGMPQQ